MFQRPRTRYAKSGDISIAYQISGEGELDLIIIPGWVSHLEKDLDDPAYISVLERLTSFRRVIRFDKRGTGLSDRNVSQHSADDRMDDVRAVMDAAGSERAAVMGVSEGGQLAVLFAASFPDRVEALILSGCYPCGGDQTDFPPADAFRKRDKLLQEYVDSDWGEGRLLDLIHPSAANDPGMREMIGEYERAAASPSAAREHLEWLLRLDVREAAKAVNVPALVLHRTDDAICPVSGGRWLGANIPNAKYVEESGDAHLLEWGDPTLFLDEIQQFLTGSRDPIEVDRVLATLLFTDIVGSTDKLNEVGDKRWRDLLSQHHSVVRQQLTRYRGREIDTAGDGFFASFDGPARAIQCAIAIRDSLRRLGFDVRAGVHTGECERQGEGLVGIAVHTAARIMGMADAGQVLVSSTVRDLVAGSRLEFRDQGEHEMKGIRGSWRIYSVDG